MQLSFTTNIHDLLRLALVCKTTLAAATITKIREPGPTGMMENWNRFKRNPCHDAYNFARSQIFVHGRHNCFFGSRQACQDYDCGTSQKPKNLIGCRYCGIYWHSRGWHWRSENWRTKLMGNLKGPQILAMCPGVVMLDNDAGESKGLAGSLMERFASPGRIP